MWLLTSFNFDRWKGGNVDWGGGSWNWESGLSSGNPTILDFRNQQAIHIFRYRLIVSKKNHSDGSRYLSRRITIRFVTQSVLENSKKVKKDAHELGIINVLANMGTTCMSLSRGNALPERGFSLPCKFGRITIIAIKLTKDFFCRYERATVTIYIDDENVMNFISF